MPRKPRIHYEGALYHVMIRGNNRSKVFETKENKVEYIRIIKKYKEKYEFKLYAYCIMDNHAHLLIEVGKIPLSKIMQVIQQVYTQRYNRIYKRTGHVFEQRYKAILCDKESYLLSLIRYIHLNPVKANMEEGLEYSWSSHKEYLKRKSELIDRDFPLSIFSENKLKRIKLYLEFMTDVKNEEIEDYELLDEEIASQTALKDDEKKLKISIDDIIDITLRMLDLSKEVLKSNKRTKQVSIARRVIILLLKKYTNVSNVAISKGLRVTKSMVSKVDEAMLHQDERLEKSYKKVEECINSTFQP